MTDNGGFSVDPDALDAYAGQLGYYEAEADKFSALVDRADVTDAAWGVVGVWAKQSYTDRLADLRSLLAEMKEGAATLSDKVRDTAAYYRGAEERAVTSFGGHQTGVEEPGR